VNVDMENVVNLVRRHVEEGIRVSGADLYPLLGRLDAIGAPRPTRNGPSGEIEFERLNWVAAILRDLPDDPQTSIASSMRASRGACSPGDDPWIELDTVYMGVEAERLEGLWRRAEVDVLRACERAVLLGRWHYLRDAVRLLEAVWSAILAHRPARLTIGRCAAQKDRLHSALSAALPRGLGAFFIRDVRELIEGAPRSRAEQWLSDASWAERRSYSLKDPGPMFAPALQAKYEQVLEEDRRARVESARRAQAAQAEMRARMDRTTAEMAEITGRETPLPLEPKADLREGADEAAPRGAGMVLVQLPTGAEYMPPYVAHAVNQELARRAAHDAILEQRERDRVEYQIQLVSR
jgi:hypothetical protein